MLKFAHTIRTRFQPIIRLTDMRLDSAEVLVRTVSPDGTVIGPETVVEAMTGTEESMALTAAIMQRAVTESELHGLQSNGLTLAFNLPLDAMLHPDLIVIVETMRERAGLRASGIGFELTERHPVNDIARVGAVITVLREAGYGMALDDITPGMTNLDALLNLPIRAVKLDRGIVMSRKASDRDFIRRMAVHAYTHRLHVIAEGIETIDTLNEMAGLGVTHGQGFLFARPLTAPALKTFLGGWSKRKSA